MYDENRTMLLQPSKEQSCYEWMLQTYERTKNYIGRDYDAFVNLDCRYTMSELIDEAEKLAAYLSAKGYKKGDVIGVFLPTSAHVVVLFYALNKLGIIGNYIHPLTPPDKLAEILAFTKTKAIFALYLSTAVYKDVYATLPTVLCTELDYTKGKVRDSLTDVTETGVYAPVPDTAVSYSSIMAGSYPPAETVKNNGLETAVYMHSSGTTGKSKTVQLSSFACNSVAFKQYAVDNRHDVGESYSLCVLPCFHAFGLATAIHYCLCNSYALILMPKFDPEKANDYIKRYRVQYIDGVPNMFRKMYEAPNFDNEGLKNLTMLFSGGDIVSESFIGEFNSVLIRRGSTARLYRGWGLTEMCAVCSTNNAYGCKPNSVGPALPGLEICILDENGNKLASGEQGEIALRGDTMMNGYLPSDDDDFTGFWYDSEGKDWIKTGDMGYVDEDGFIFFTGRKKRIIIISGYNIYPYSIEQTLNALPYVTEVCAVQGYDEKAKPIVKLCAVKSNPEDSDEEIKEKLLAFCRKHLGGFSVPRKVVFMERLPRTKMDKLDFIAMSDPVPQ